MGDFDKSDLPALPSSVEAREAYFTWGRKKYADEIRMITEHIIKVSAAGNTDATIGFTARLQWSGSPSQVDDQRILEAQRIRIFIGEYFRHLNYVERNGNSQNIRSANQLEHKKSLLVTERPRRSVHLHVLWMYVDWSEQPHQSVFVVNR
jgi:hypothetical protein